MPCSSVFVSSQVMLMRLLITICGKLINKSNGQDPFPCAAWLPPWTSTADISWFWRGSKKRNVLILDLIVSTWLVVSLVIIECNTAEHLVMKISLDYFFSKLSYFQRPCRSSVLFVISTVFLGFLCSASLSLHVLNRQQRLCPPLHFPLLFWVNFNAFISHKLPAADLSTWIYWCRGAHWFAGIVSAMNQWPWAGFRSCREF